MLSALQQLTARAASTLPAHPTFLPGPRVTNRASLQPLFYLSIKSFVHDSQVGGPSWAAP